jgi:hypothetical protein
LAKISRLSIFFRQTHYILKKILELLGNMRVNKNDTVIFYYTGHGALDQNRGLFYTITDPARPYKNDNDQGTVNHLLKENVLRAIQKHSPRLIVIVSDCCSSFHLYQDGIVDGFSKARAPDGDSPLPLFQKLFLESRGVVDFTSGQDGKVTFVWNDSTGPFMTYVLCEQLYSNSDRRLTWAQFFPVVQRETAEYSKRRRTQNANDPVWKKYGDHIPQVPKAFSLGN